MIKKALLLIFISIFLSGSLCSAPKPKKKTTKTSKQSLKRKQYVDLEGLDITGLIDRPRTLYIIKKSDVEFKDNFADYDYVDAIIEPTYTEPF